MVGARRRRICAIAHGPRAGAVTVIGGGADRGPVAGCSLRIHWGGKLNRNRNHQLGRGRDVEAGWVALVWMLN
jgi:hypothetical protein